MVRRPLAALSALLFVLACGEAKTHSDAGIPDDDEPGLDAGAFDAAGPQEPDAGTQDAGNGDSGPIDAGLADSGLPDAGLEDAGVPHQKDAGIADAGDQGLCADRTGGALITFQIVNETMTAWITNDAFIDEAITLQASGASRVAMFNDLLDGTDCDPQWTWHVGAAQASWVDFAIELCDGTPSFVEQEKSYWLNTVGQFCPWNTKVASVDDRR